MIYRETTCPFCGGKARMRSEIRGYGQSWARMVCLECEGAGPRIAGDQDVNTLEEQAEEAWNTRFEHVTTPYDPD